MGEGFLLSSVFRWSLDPSQSWTSASAAPYAKLFRATAEVTSFRAVWRCCCVAAGLGP